MAVKTKKETVAGTDTGAEKDTTAKKTAAKKTAAKKAEAPEAAEAVQAAEAVKEEAPKKSAAKKTTAKKEEPEVTFTIQYHNKDISACQVLEAAKKAYEKTNPDVEIKTLDLYVKPEEGAAYYVVNGEGSGDYKINL